MKQPRPNSRRSFFWQGVLILLPVLVLAAVGMHSLHQDRLSVFHEAKERAQAIADDRREKIWSVLSRPDNSREDFVSFTTDLQGRLVSPTPFSKLPVPHPLDVTKLSDEQFRYWQSAQTGEWSGVGAASIAEAYRAFINLYPPGDFSAVAHYGLAITLVRLKDFQGAKQELQTIISQHKEAFSESGLSLEQLARLRLAEIDTQDAPENWAERCQQLGEYFINHPSPMTPVYLQKIEDIGAGRGLPNVTRNLRGQWEQDENARELFANAISIAPTIPGLTAAADRFPEMFWFAASVREPKSRKSIPMPAAATQTEGEESVMRPAHSDKGEQELSETVWLATRWRDGKGNLEYLCRTEAAIARTVTEVLRTTSGLPDYFGISVEFAGRSVLSSNNLSVWYDTGGGGKGGGSHRVFLGFTPQILASAKGTRAGQDLIAVNVHLTSTTALYDRQNARNTRFGLLIGTATLAALIGFVSARRAFTRQQLLNEMKDNFVSSVSHELRAPIASVRLMAESLEQGRIAEAPKQNEYYRFIGQECRRLSSLIENVLDFSRIEQGRKQYEFEPVDVAALVRQTITLMTPAAAEAQVSLVTSLDEAALSRLSAPPCLDGQAIQQALINLTDNAIKHSPKGSTVEVKLESMPQRLRFTVSDQGSGIPPEEHDKIFERFYRRGSELRRETQGVGIGLSIVKHIVEAHGGTIAVESGAGQGSRFVIELPLQPGTKST